MGAYTDNDNQSSALNGGIRDASGPWGTGGGSGGGNNGGGQRPGSGGNNGNGQRPPNLEDLLKRSKDQFGGNRGGSGRPGGNRGGSGAGMPGGISIGTLIPLGLIVLVVFWLANGFYRVETAEVGIVKTFGKHTGNTKPGLNWHLPWPIQSAETVNIQVKKKTDIGFVMQGSRRMDIPRESQMLTGDQNIIDMDVTIVWRISKPQDYLFEITAPEETVKIAAESAIREIMGRTDIADALTDAKEQVRIRSLNLLQETLDSYSSGIAIDDVLLQEVRPPNEVRDAFDDVQRALQDRETQQNEANQYANKATQEALGAVQVLIKQAEGYKQSLVNQARGEAKRFESVLEAYNGNQEITLKRIFIETAKEIFSNREIVVIDKSLNKNSFIFDSSSGKLENQKLMSALNSDRDNQSINNSSDGVSQSSITQFNGK